MPSRYAGMDPDIEAQGSWPHFHLALIAELANFANRHLSRYAAQMDTDVWIHEPTAEERRALGEPPSRRRSMSGSSASATRCRRFRFRWSPASRTSHCRWASASLGFTTAADVGCCWTTRIRWSRH